MTMVREQTGPFGGPTKEVMSVAQRSEQVARAASVMVANAMSVLSGV